MTKSLWPDEISVIQEVPPVAILREQAALLGEKTKNLVTAEVDSEAMGESIIDTFYLVAPALDNYRFKLFEVSRDIETFYPLKISSSKLRMYGDKIVKVISEDELFKALEDIFSDSRTIKIIQSMLAQSGWEPEILF